MPKIKQLLFKIKGVAHKININCTSKGVFTANIPREVSDALGVEDQYRCSKLETLEETIIKAFERYKNAQTSQTLHISIRYGASMKFRSDENGVYVVGNEFAISASWHEINNIMGFDFEVLICENVDGHESWHQARYGYEDVFDRPKEGEEKAWHKYGARHLSDKCKVIPYSENAVKNLEKIHEVIRKSSLKLHELINSDVSVLTEALNTGVKLIGE